MALVKVFTVEVYDDPQLAIKDGTTRGYFMTVAGLVANLEVSIEEFMEAKNITLGDKGAVEELDLDEEIEEIKDE